MRSDRDCILALSMNNQPLTPAHGYPVRAILPGIAGARSVKWLDRITVASAESPNFYQKHDYKILPPDATDAESAEKYWGVVEGLNDMPVHSAIASPGQEEQVERDADGKVEVRGYALPGGDHGPVVRVQVSGDEGERWVDAELDFGGLDPEKDGGREVKWAWCLWKAKVGLEKGDGKKLLSRAYDQGGNVQPERCEWNLRGVAYNGYGEVRDLHVV